MMQLGLFLYNVSALLSIEKNVPAKKTVDDDVKKIHSIYATWRSEKVTNKKIEKPC